MSTHARFFVPHSCGHRNCPHCQHHESQQWLERQLKKQVPGAYFLLTFTLPAELRPLAWSHQRMLYALMMQCSWETVRSFSLNDKQLQGTPGAIAVLHTHSRRLEYPLLCAWPGDLPLSKQQDPQDGNMHPGRVRFPLATPPACSAQGLSARPQLRFPIALPRQGLPPRKIRRAYPGAITLGIRRGGFLPSLLMPLLANSSIH